MLTKTEAIVIKSMKYRDTSKIVTLYTKEFGKLKGIAKGARSIKNKFGSALEPLTHAMLVVYKKEHKDLHLISQCDSINTFKQTIKDLDKLLIALDILGLVDAVTHDEAKNVQLYNLLLETLKNLDSSKKNYSLYLQAFGLQVAVLFGYSPNLQSCGKCGRSIELEEIQKSIIFQIEKGALLCNKCEQKYYSRNAQNSFDGVTTITSDCLRISRELLHNSYSNIPNINCKENTGNEIYSLIRLYLHYHFGRLKLGNSKYSLQ